MEILICSGPPAHIIIIIINCPPAHISKVLPVVAPHSPHTDRVDWLVVNTMMMMVMVIVIKMITIVIMMMGGERIRMRRNHLTVERFPGVRFNQLERSLVQLRVIISYQLSYTTYIYYIRHHLIIIIYNIIILKTIITTCKISCSPLAQTPATSPPSRSLLDKSTMHLSTSSHHLHPDHLYHLHHDHPIHEVSTMGSVPWVSDAMFSQT